MSGVDEATKIVHSTQPTSHRGDDANLVHNPTGGTAEFSHGVNSNPAGAKAEFSHGVVDTNPLGDHGHSYVDYSRGVSHNPAGGSAPFNHGVVVPPLGGKAPFSKGVVDTNPKGG